ncbi:hypothetical protein [Nocardioides sp. R-C-SC26]|uniref:hypothetical protein n=1 Tax=Nocardioides sp. R-C-SC26 TaxID=2870414 RepID=UPI001E5FF794|nr:hypothetical protein [Nocardioides sp. R-C-SC26]
MNQSQHDAASALEDAVRAASDGTPYQVASADGGFDVVLDLADAQWWGAFNRAGLRKSFTHEVRLRGEGRYTITDVAREVEWIAGTPRIAASGTVERGRIHKVGFEKTYALDDDLRPAEVVSYSFSSGTGRRLIEDAAEGLGLRQQMPIEQRMALGVAILAGGGLLVAGVILLILWLAGSL